MAIIIRKKTESDTTTNQIGVSVGCNPRRLVASISRHPLNTIPLNNSVSKQLADGMRKDHTPRHRPSDLFSLASVRRTALNETVSALWTGTVDIPSLSDCFSGVAAYNSSPFSLTRFDNGPASSWEATIPMTAGITH
ncbi:MAG: hypothetical protein HQL54_09760 [Magnetococcales bacterium]|nr:hypothetical protein [Magnetococcales bacterium]